MRILGGAARFAGACPRGDFQPRCCVGRPLRYRPYRPQPTTIFSLSENRDPPDPCPTTKSGSTTSL